MFDPQLPLEIFAEEKARTRNGGGSNPAWAIHYFFFRDLDRSKFAEIDFGGCELTPPDIS